MVKCPSKTYSPVFGNASTAYELQDGNSQDSWHQVHGSCVLPSI